MRSLKKQVKTSKRNTKNNPKKNKSLKKRRGGSVMKDILSEVSNLAVPVGLVAARSLLKNRNKKNKKK